jgi:hypothetical protein
MAFRAIVMRRSVDVEDADSRDRVAPAGGPKPTRGPERFAQRHASVTIFLNSSRGLIPPGLCVNTSPNRSCVGSTHA